ncbi:MAG: tripartite tricarboxylate transporter substrate binding protein [Desulfobacteraceae bacterium]|nr:MAG: tripartite tricarboxylate transporter substrate binding protein [Desulfobacteraceae bacterium]
MKMKLSIRAFLFFSAVVLGLVPFSFAADNYPARPVTVIVPVEAGGDADIVTRPLMERVAKILGQPFVIVNKPGAGQTIGYREVYQAKPDGYTIGMGVASLITAKLQGFLPYDYRDFTLMGNFWSANPLIIASTKTSRPFKTVQELFDYAKSHPGEVSLATTAVGGPFWNSALMIQERTGIKFNVIPQEGSAGFVLQQVAGGHTDTGISGSSAAKPQIDAGNVLPLAIIGPNRFPGKFNFIPTLKEIGYDVSFRTFGVVIGPPKMPKDAASKLIKAVETACKDPEYQSLIASRFDTALYQSPDEFLKSADEDRKNLRAIFEKTGLLKEKK